MKWLVTAFEPFGGASSNSSLIVLRELERLHWNGNVRFFAPVPVTFVDAWPSVRNALTPDIGGVLALGQAEGRARICFERVALNFQDARIVDNAGAQPREARVSSDAVEMHWSPIPWPRFSLPQNCELSYSAGTFVCNTLMFHILDWARTHGKLGGFVHIPLVTGQGEFEGQPRMDAIEAVACMKSALQFLVGL